MCLDKDTNKSGIGKAETEKSSAFPATVGTHSVFIADGRPFTDDGHTFIDDECPFIGR